MTIKETIKKHAHELQGITHIPNKEVEILIQHLLKKNTIWLHLNYNNEFTAQKELAQLVKKRASNYPLEYLIEKVSFFGETFFIKEGVLIPRPETELLIEKAIDMLKNIKGKKRILEIGVGSGVIGIMIALLVDDIEVVGVDINDNALKLAQENAIKHKVQNSMTFIKSNLYEHVTGEFDLCISNPPYIANEYELPENVKYEPSNALFGGAVGDELLKAIIKDTFNQKIPYLLCEMGYDQKQAIVDYLQKFPIKKVEFYKDYSDFDRGFMLEFKP